MPNTYPIFPVICLLAFDVRLDSFSEEQMDPGSLSSRLMESAETTNSCILPTDQGFQLWRYFETPAYRRLLRCGIRTMIRWWWCRPKTPRASCPRSWSAPWTVTRWRKR